MDKNKLLNDLDAVLNIKLTNLYIKSIKWDRLRKFIKNSFNQVESIALTNEELNTIVCDSDYYILKNTYTIVQKNKKIKYNGAYIKFTNGPFTLKQVMENLLIFEKEDRMLACYDNSFEPNTHHIYFEGFIKIDKNTYIPRWGS